MWIGACWVIGAARAPSICDPNPKISRAPDGDFVAVGAVAVGSAVAAGPGSDVAEAVCVGGAVEAAGAVGATVGRGVATGAVVGAGVLVGVGVGGGSACPDVTVIVVDATTTSFGDELCRPDLVTACAATWCDPVSVFAGTFITTAKLPLPLAWKAGPEAPSSAT
jgi:hypothetical protein